MSNLRSNTGKKSKRNVWIQTCSKHKELFFFTFIFLVEVTRRWTRGRSACSFSPSTSSFLRSPLVLHLKPSGWYRRRFSLICPTPAVFLPRPLLLVVLPDRLRYAAHLRVGRMVGTLNLLMQPFVAIASELALPLPGSADRCSRTLPQLAAIGYLLLSCVCVCVCVSECACVYVSTICAAQTKVAHK